MPILLDLFAHVILRGLLCDKCEFLVTRKWCFGSENVWDIRDIVGVFWEVLGLYLIRFVMTYEVMMVGVEFRQVKRVILFGFTLS